MWVNNQISVRVCNTKQTVVTSVTLHASETCFDDT